MKLLILGFIIGIIFSFIVHKVTEYFDLDLADFTAWLVAQPIIFIRWIINSIKLKIIKK